MKICPAGDKSIFLVSEVRPEKKEMELVLLSIGRLLGLTSTTKTPISLVTDPGDELFFSSNWFNVAF